LTRRLPAEWEKQDAVLISFPHKNSDWANDLASAKSIFLRIANSISYKQKLILICDDIEATKSIFCYHDKISFVKLETDDTWIRDYGPISIFEDGERKLIDFKFNAWGGKFASELDNAVTKKLHDKCYFSLSELIKEDFILEGGSIDSDGQGTILTTSKCLLNPNRNPSMTKTGIEEKFKTLFGTKRVLWLDYGELEGDDTDAHIDTLARFVDSKTIVYVEGFPQMLEQLKSFKTYDGKNYHLIPLPLPSSKYKNFQKLPATYANFLIINHAVLLPIYDDKKDEEMIKLFKSLFPTREIIPINSLRLIEEGGSIHCSTMNIVSRETL